MDTDPATAACGMSSPSSTDSGDGPPLTRRTRNRNERRNRVFGAAIALFVERGFDDTSMDDIAARADLGRTTVFNHFPRKAQFLEDWTLRRRRRAQRAFADVTPRSTSLRVRLGRYLAELAVLNEETRTETMAIMPLAVRHAGILVDHPLGRDLAEIISGAPSELRADADAGLIGRLLALGYFSAVCRWIETDPPAFDLGDDLARLLETVLDGALVPGGHR